MPSWSSIGKAQLPLLPNYCAVTLRQTARSIASELLVRAKLSKCRTLQKVFTISENILRAFGVVFMLNSDPGQAETGSGGWCVKA